MTNDSGLFRDRRRLEEDEGAWQIGGNIWESAADKWLPLYEGKMIQAYDHRAADVQVNLANQFRPAQPIPASVEQHFDPSWCPTPQYWVKESECDLSQRQPWVLTFKEITAPTNARTMIAAGCPAYGFGNKVPLLSPNERHRDFDLLLANLNSTAFDYVARQKVQGQTLNLFIIEQLPVVAPATFQGTLFGPRSAVEIVRPAVLELTYTAHDMAAFARDLGHVDAAGTVLPPFNWDPQRRLRLRAKLDAVFFHLYGIFDAADRARSRDDIAYIYSTFPIVERQEMGALRPLSPPRPLPGLLQRTCSWPAGRGA